MTSTLNIAATVVTNNSYIPLTRAQGRFAQA